MSRWTRILPTTVAVVLVGGVIAAHDVDAPKDKSKAAKPPTAPVQKGPFRVEVVLKGMFESPAMQEVTVHLEAWGAAGGPLTVASASEPGAIVKKGDVLLRLDVDRIAKAIRDLKADQHLADIGLKQLELDVQALSQSTPLDLTASERNRKIADEDWKRFNEVEKAFSEESMKHQVKMSRQSLEYAQEELKQLEKMYRTKDLTEETEEIILKRQRNQIDYYTFALKQAEMRRDQFFAFDLPRRIERLKDDVARTALAWDKAKVSLPMQFETRKLALDKAKYERARAAERLDNLVKDAEHFVVRAPGDGIVYYGRCSQGQFSSAGGLLARLQRGGVIQPDEVLMTIVQPRPLFVRATLDEKDSLLVTAGATCKVSPASAPDTRLHGKIDQVSATPIAPGTFEARASVELGDVKIAPGMACSLKVVPYQRADALIVPSTCVFPDDLDDDKSLVYVYRPDSGKFDKKPIVVGKRAGGRVEVVSGVNAGDELAITKPEAKELSDR